MSDNTIHEEYMKLALAEAEKSYFNGEVPVGAVIIDPATSKVITQYGNQTNKDRNGVRHCEFLCLKEISEAFPETFTEFHLYVTVEPCIMCAAAYRFMGVTAIFFGCFNERFGGCGSVLDVATSPEGTLTPLRIKGGILETEAVEILKKFYARGNPNAPAMKRHRPLEELAI
jgi:tRNA-specific adenosine deaminase 2